jgi:hypothetical protein
MTRRTTTKERETREALKSLRRKEKEAQMVAEKVNEPRLLRRLETRLV